MTKKAALKELNVTMSRKEWSDDAGSLGVTVGIVLEVGDEDKDEVYAGAISWVSAKIDGTLKAHGRIASPTEPPKKATAPQPQQSGLLDDTSKTFVVETLSVEIKGGKRYVKAKGGNFKRYGVNVWKEVLALPPLELNIDELDGSDFPAPPGLTAIYIEKAIEKDGEQKMVPDKVTGWA